MSFRKRILSILILLSFISPSLSAAAPPPRIAGANRYATSIALSQASYSKADTITLVSGINSADALTASTLANLMKGPMLLCPDDHLSPELKKELSRLGVQSALLIGGNSSLSPQIETELKRLGIKTERLAGADRYATSLRILDRILTLTKPKNLLVAHNEADAISSSAYRRDDKPLVLYRDNAEAILRYQIPVTLIGGEQSLSADVAKKLHAEDRIAGKNRYETALRLAERSGAQRFVIVNAHLFQDALSASSYAFVHHAAILLSERDHLEPSVRAFLNGRPATLIGGTASLSNNLFEKPVPENALFESWRTRNGYSDRPRLTPAQIEALNNTALHDTPTLYQPWANSADSAAIRAQILKLSGHHANAAVSGVTGQKEYAVTVRRVSLRKYPSSTQKITENGDLYVETTVNPGEPVSILHRSKDKKFAFVMTRDYLAWAPADALALTDQNTLRTLYSSYKNQAVVSQKQMVIDDNIWRMGAHVLLYKGEVAVPIKDADGRLQWRYVAQPEGVGVLPFTEENIVRQAMRFLDTKYGWGDSLDGIDCSGFVQDVYGSMGIILPRNTQTQRLYAPAEKQMVKGLSLKEAARLQIGDLLYTDSHVMIYIGKDEADRPSVIHATGGRIGRVVIEPLSKTGQMSRIISLVRIPKS